MDASGKVCGQYDCYARHWWLKEIGNPLTSLCKGMILSQKVRGYVSILKWGNDIIRLVENMLVRA
jgi:hypothetical protein